jgi:transcriptional regulator with XRE-family HTH domain
MQEIRYLAQSAQWKCMYAQRKSPLREALTAFGATLDQLLEKEDISQAELGRLMTKDGHEIATKTINNIVKARHPPELDNLAAIAAYFEVPLWVMFIPGLKPELLDKDKLERLIKYVEDYLQCTDNERRHPEGIVSGFAAAHRRSPPTE